MSAKVSSELIRQSARQLRRMRVGPKRAKWLARDVERINNTALDAAAGNDFNDEPARFAAVLAALKHRDHR